MEARLDAVTQSGAAESRRPARYQRTCEECGTPYGSSEAHSQFCGTQCRRDFNNRRATRGAELYDLFMELRFNRKGAQKMGVWRLLCRMAMHFRDEDHQARAGRKSWRPARSVLEKRPYLYATTVARGIAGGRR